ncbi:MAG TPA: MFS transporter [Pseudonocardiaceae bacterium]|nr:MFS transporter [Pseudonocardiaceae bacterium]
MAVDLGVSRPETGYRRGTPGFRRICLAMFSAGLATFTTLYCVQALLPALATEFRLTPAAASLAVSVGTGALAVGIIPLTALSEALGRTRVMTVSLFTSSVLGVLAAASPNFTVLLVARGLQGLALAGLQAVAMSYLAEELHCGSLGAAMGLFIAGNGIGGMSGRLLGAFLGEAAGWRWVLAVIGLFALACSVLFRLAVPASRYFRPRPLRLRALAGAIGHACTDTGLPLLFAVGILGTSTLVTVYNYLGFRLLRAPFDLPGTVVGLIFVIYLAGSFSSTVAGRLADRFGRQRLVWPAAVVMLLGIVLLWPDQLAVLVVGLVVLTSGFFALHALASGWVSARSAALGVQGSDVYLCAFYLGSSVGGSVGGLAFGAGGWTGVTWYIGAFTLVIIGLGLVLRRLAPVIRRVG